MKRNEELITTSFEVGDSGFSNGLNVEITSDGTIKRRKGFNTFGEMVHVLWELNKKAKKMGWSSDYTVRLPLKGIKPIYKKTLKKD
jgi:hypothetical protein